MSTIRVMLVDDHTVIRAGLRMLVNGQADMEVVAEAESAAAALALATAESPDVLILDLTLRDGGSLQLLETLSARQAAPRVLLLTMHNDTAYVRAALAAGASGYVVKTVREQDLLAAVRSVHRNQVFVDLDDEALTASVFASFGHRDAKGQARPGVKLSSREVEVLRLLGQGFTSQAVGVHLDLSPKTVATYKARIAEKLGLKTTVDFVKYATATGLPRSVEGLT